MKLKISNLNLPTPAKWRKIGHGVMVASQAAAGCAVFANHTTLAIVIAVAGVAGNFVVDMTSDAK